MMPRERTELLGQEYLHTLPGNSLDLNPMENLREIVNTQLTEAKSCSSVEQMTAMTKSTWANILLSALCNLVSGLSQRMYVEVLNVFRRAHWVVISNTERCWYVDICDRGAF